MPDPIDPIDNDVGDASHFPTIARDSPWHEKALDERRAADGPGLQPYAYSLVAASTVVAH